MCINLSIFISPHDLLEHNNLAQRKPSPSNDRTPLDSKRVYLGHNHSISILYILAEAVFNSMDTFIVIIELRNLLVQFSKIGFSTA